MIGDIGKKVSKKELDNSWKNWRKGDKTRILDFNHKRIIFPDDFYTSNGPASLNWEELNYISKRDNEGGVILHRGFDGLLDSLCNNLTEKGLMSKDYLSEGDFFLINVGGIKVRYRDGSDPHGRTAFSERIYYPRLKEDAEEYAKYFYGKALYPVYVSQIISVPNRDWDISKKE